jgi:hypothetical protein
VSRAAVGALLLCSVWAGACATDRHTRIAVQYSLREPVGPVAVETVNATGRALPLPSAGLIERAVRLVTRQQEAESSITDTFTEAAAEDLSRMGIHTTSSEVAGARRLHISLTDWDVQDGASSEGVVFVNADYQLVDAQGGLLWEVVQSRFPVRLSGPNLSRYEVVRVARACVEHAFVSLPRSTAGASPPQAQ